MEQTSRIELARHRLRIARRAIGVVAAAGFVERRDDRLVGSDAVGVRAG
jgi:hypothetical protein